MYFWLERYLQSRRVEALRDAPRSGRPLAAASITPELIFQELSCPPSDWGYSTHTWTVALLASHLERHYGCAIHPDTLRRRMRAMGLRWKRPRYVYSEKASHLPQKKAMHRERWPDDTSPPRVCSVARRAPDPRQPHRARYDTWRVLNATGLR